MSELCQLAEREERTLSQVILSDQAEQLEQSEQDLYDQMAARLRVMRESVQAGMDPELRSASGLSGGDAAKMLRYAAAGGMTGTFVNEAIARALAASECNAAMGKIVAAPTAGSCGILPGTVLSVLEAGQCSEQQAVMALFTAGGIGMVIGNRATLAGAEGGCQAECGSAAEMALAGIESKIPVDECIETMYRVGCALPGSLRETAQGGLAATPTGIRLKKEIFGSNQGAEEH